MSDNQTHSGQGSPSWPTGFMVIQGNLQEDLRHVLVDWCQRYPLGPLEDETILVQSNGIAQWLKLALAEQPAETSDSDQDNSLHGFGIAAAINTTLPGRFVWQAYSSFLPELPKGSPFDKSALTWRIYRLLGRSALTDPSSQSDQSSLSPPSVLLDLPVLAPLKSYLSESSELRGDQEKRLYHLSAMLADLFDQYQVYRADWLTLWQNGRDVITTAQGKERVLESDQLWQPELWRRIVKDVEEDTELLMIEGLSSRSDVHQRFLKAARDCPAGQRPVGLPRRVIVFGITSLPQQTLEVLKAVSHLCQILLFVSNPCQFYWGDIVEGRDLLRQEYKRQRRKQGGRLSGGGLSEGSAGLSEGGCNLPEDAGDLSENDGALNGNTFNPDTFNPDDLHQYGHPLLASWGKQGRDYLHLLDEQDEKEAYESYFDGRIDLFRSVKDHEQAGLLNQIQEDILQLNTLQDRKERHGQDSQDSRGIFDPDSDNSLRFSIAHSPQREVEVLHDQLLAEFEQARQQGDNLQPRDILVMVPDIHVYAPHIDAVFGRYMNSNLSAVQSSPVRDGHSAGARAGDTRYQSPHDLRYLPYHISDQGQRSRNTLLIAFEKLTTIEHARFTVNDLRTLLEVPAVMAAMGLTEEDLERLQQWIEGAQIRWGLSAEQKTDFQLPSGQEGNTWRSGMRRMLLGFASGQHTDHWQDIEPYSEVGGLEAALAGPLVKLLDHLETWWRLQKHAFSTPQWTEHLHQLTLNLFIAVSPEDQWALEQIEQASETLIEFVRHAGLAEESMPLGIVAPALLEQIDQPSLTQKFLGGSINFATLMPMRAVPFRQIWLLGMNDGDYPRSHSAADFDLMAEHYRPGDRSRREDDRYLLLEALLSARDKLAISWVGRSIRDNNEKPPSVLVGQLRDHLASGWRLKNCTAKRRSDQRSALLEAMTTEYPMQPFSPDYFIPDRDARLFTYGAEWRAIHQAQPHGDHSRSDEYRKPGSQLQPKPQPQSQTQPQAQPRPGLDAWYPDGQVSLKALADFLKSPVDAFFAQRLQVFRPEALSVPSDTETYTFSGLDNWLLKDQLIAETFYSDLTEADWQKAADAFVEKKQREGVLIQGNLGRLHARTHFDNMPELYQKWRNLLERYPTPLRHIPPFEHSAQQHYRRGDQETGDMLPIWQFETLLTEIRQSESGEQAQICLSTSSLRTDKKPQWRNYILPWLKHLVACAQFNPSSRKEGHPDPDSDGDTDVNPEGYPGLTTHVISPAGEVSFAPVPADQAGEQLDQLLNLWWQGMQAPLPLALNAGFSWLYHQSRNGVDAKTDGAETGGSKTDRDASTDSDWNDRHDLAGITAIQEAYDRDLLHSTYLAREYPTLTELCQSDTPSSNWHARSFAIYAEQAYGRLFEQEA